MDRIYHLIREHWHLNHAQYYHLHLISTVLLGPLLGALALLVIAFRRWRNRATTAD